MTKTITYNPETHKLVPLEPTKEMLAVGQRNWLDCEGADPSHDIYKAMLTAAPATEEAPQQEPDWSNSETLPTELWKNPMTSLALRLEMADGAVAFQRDVIANLRKQLEQQPATHGEPVARVDYEKRGNIAWLFGPQLPDGTELFKAPQPTPDHIKAMQQASTD